MSFIWVEQGHSFHDTQKGNLLVIITYLKSVKAGSKLDTLVLADIPTMKYPSRRPPACEKIKEEANPRCP